MKHEKRFNDAIERLRSSERTELLEVDRVVDLCLEGIAPASVLDVGTGSGLFAEAFALRGLEVTGLDPNPDMLETARGFVPGGTFVEGTAEDIPFPDDSFDLVYLGHVLHETDDTLLALQEARRVARARVVVLEWPYRDEENGPPPAHRLKEETVTQLAHEAGFRHVETMHLSHMVLFRFED